MELQTEPFNLGPLAVWSHRAANPLARVFLIHGLAEHSGRHLGTVRYLLDNGIDVVRFDLRGAGRSGGQRQWVEKFDHYIADATRVLNWVWREQDPIPMFVLGHSLGGTIATYFTAQHQSAFQGLILSAPGYIPGSSIAPWKLMAARTLCRVLPRLRLSSANAGTLSRDPEIEKAYDCDPLSFRYARLHQGTEILRAFEGMDEPVRSLRLPTLIVHGSGDRVVSLEGSFRLFSNLGSKDKILHVIPGGYHEPHNDLDKAEYFSTVVTWIRKRVG